MPAQIIICLLPKIVAWRPLPAFRHTTHWSFRVEAEISKSIIKIELGSLLALLSGIRPSMTIKYNLQDNQSLSGCWLDFRESDTRSS